MAIASRAKITSGGRERPLLLVLAWTILLLISVTQLVVWSNRLKGPAASAPPIPSTDQPATTSGSVTDRRRPLKSHVLCGQPKSDAQALTPRELDFQQQRQTILAEAHGNPVGGYASICLAVRNQHDDLPDWLEYHQRLGVSHVYVMDDGSEPPLNDVLAPFIKVRNGLFFLTCFSCKTRCRMYCLYDRL